MTAKQSIRLTQRALRAARVFRSAAIDADSAIPDNRALRRLRDLAELCTGHAMDALVEAYEAARDFKKANGRRK